MCVCDDVSHAYFTVVSFWFCVCLFYALRLCPQGRPPTPHAITTPCLWCRQIKRPYFHVVPLDKRQLRAWRDYLELEAADGDHHSLVQLYERCLIACAQYEEFWMQYARYLERRLPAAAETDKPSQPVGAGAEAASFAGATPAGPGAADDAAVQRLLTADQSGRDAAVSFETESQRLPEQRADVGAGYTPLEDPADAVREVYKRACLVHCPSKPNVRMQWAAFEESVGERPPRDRRCRPDRRWGLLEPVVITGSSGKGRWETIAISRDNRTL